MNKWPLLGSLMLVLGAIGHFIIVDLSLWICEAGYVHWFPHSLLPEMKSTVVKWEMLGSNTLLNIFSGFSLWMVFSLFMLALYNFFIFRLLERGHILRRITLLMSLVLSFVFFVFSVICFIYPPVIGAALAAIFFTLGIKKEIAP
ncbi:MAG: hypothetical protein ACHQF2_07925 [Flavobacteriales bacterium]